MNRRVLIILALALTAALVLIGYQQQRLRQAEEILGQYWSNSFAMTFSRIGLLRSDLQGVAAEGQISRERRESLEQSLRVQTLHLNNTLGDTRYYLRDVPQVPHLMGYLREVEDLLNRQHGPLTDQQQAQFQRYADMAAELVAIIREYYPDYPGDGGFSNDDRFWRRGFLSDLRWRQMLTRMDDAAQQAGYWRR